MIFNILPDNFINLPNLPYFILSRFYFYLHVEGPPGEAEPVLSGSREFPGKGSPAAKPLRVLVTYLTVAYRLNHPEVGYGRFPREL